MAENGLGNRAISVALRIRRPGYLYLDIGQNGEGFLTLIDEDSRKESVRITLPNGPTEGEVSQLNDSRNDSKFYINHPELLHFGLPTPAVWSPPRSINEMKCTSVFHTPATRNTMQLEAVNKQRVLELEWKKFDGEDDDEEDQIFDSKSKFLTRVYTEELLKNGSNSDAFKRGNETDDNGNNFKPNFKAAEVCGDDCSGSDKSDDSFETATCIALKYVTCDEA